MNLEYPLTIVLELLRQIFGQKTFSGKGPLVS